MANFKGWQQKLLGKAFRSLNRRIVRIVESSNESAVYQSASTLTVQSLYDRQMMNPEKTRDDALKHSTIRTIRRFIVSFECLTIIVRTQILPRAMKRRVDWKFGRLEI